MALKSKLSSCLTTGNPEPGDAEALEMGHPRLLVFEALAFVPSEPGDHQPREAPAAHVSQRLVVDHVVGGASPQKRQEVQPAENGGDKLVHGSGGISQLWAE